MLLANTCRTLEQYHFSNTEVLLQRWLAVRRGRSYGSHEHPTQSGELWSTVEPLETTFQRFHGSFLDELNWCALTGMQCRMLAETASNATLQTPLQGIFRMYRESGIRFFKTSVCAKRRAVAHACHWPITLDPAIQSGSSLHRAS